MATDPEEYDRVVADKSKIQKRILNNKGQVTEEEQKIFEPAEFIQPILGGDPVYIDDIDKQMKLGKAVPDSGVGVKAAFYVDEQADEEKKSSRVSYDATVQAP